MSRRGAARRRVRALDSSGRPVRGLYIRDGKFIAGFRCPQSGRWRMDTLEARTLRAARVERESLLAALREGRRPASSPITFAEMFDEYQASRVIADRTAADERHLLNRHLKELQPRRVQAISTKEAARLLARLRVRYSEWTCQGVYAVMRGVFGLAVTRGVIVNSPLDGLTRAEIPKQRNARPVARLDASAIAKLVDAGTSERWRAALGLAGYAGLRLSEIRALTWEAVDLQANVLAVRTAMRPDGTIKEPKTDAGVRTVPVLPALRRALVDWGEKSSHHLRNDYVICTKSGSSVSERSLRDALATAREAAGLADIDGRLSWHSLRHSFACVLATELDVPPTTLARLVGHTNPEFTLKVYARDARSTKIIVEDVLRRAERVGRGR